MIKDIKFSSLVEKLNKKHYTKKDFEEFVRNLTPYETNYNIAYLLCDLASNDELEEASTETFIKHQVFSNNNSEDIIIPIHRVADYCSDFRVTDANNNEIPYKICITTDDVTRTIDPLKNKDFQWICLLSPFSRCEIIIERKEPREYNEIYVWYNAHLLNSPKRESFANLVTDNNIITSTNRYHKGSCYMLDSLKISN